MSDEQTADVNAAAWAAIQDRLGELVAHPFADFFPMIPDNEAKELADDIAANGLLEPIILWGELILDGRNRHRALALAGIPYEREHFAFFHGSDEDAAAYVESKNVKRRHLSGSQRALAMARFMNMRGAGRKLNETEAAKLAKVAPVTIMRSRRIVAEAPKSLQGMVERGELGSSLAYEAVRNIPMASLAQIKTAGALKQALKDKGKYGKEFGDRSETRLADNLQGILETLALRDVSVLVPIQAELDACHQQLITLCQAVAEEKADQVAKQASAA